VALVINAQLDQYAGLKLCWLLYEGFAEPAAIHNVAIVRRPLMSERAPSKAVIPATVLILAAMLLIAVLYTINPVRRQIVASPHTFIPATGPKVEWRDR